MDLALKSVLRLGSVGGSFFIFPNLDFRYPFWIALIRLNKY
ncbi:hypothetical protein I600_723 [Maribacter dokdonensis DSW-8]|nr:hypothetical protein I600_723 [Maribacter dokdonensis DSW-8]